MNKRERRIIQKLVAELSMRKSEHPALYSAWWILSEMLHGKLGSAERLADLSLKVSKTVIKKRRC